MKTATDRVILVIKMLSTTNQFRFTTSDFGYLEINLKSIDSDEERLSIADLIRFFARKIEDFEDMTWVEFESEIKRFHGIDERELM